MKKELKAANIDGIVTAGFEKVRDVFIENFKTRGEVGAAVSVIFQGKKVVDLWGGIKDVKTSAVWQDNSLCPVFSTTKGVTALTIALAVSRGILDYEAFISDYWPEFSQNGKGRITLRQLLSHQAGLSMIDVPVSAETLKNPDTLADILAGQRPAWTPGKHQGYHCWSQGFYLSELLRRADQNHRSLGQYFLDELAKPLGLDFFIGLPSSVPDERLATLIPFHPIELVFNMDKMPMGMVLALLNPHSLTSRSFMNPAVCAKHTNFNTRELLSLEIPSGGGIGTARAVAELYWEFASGGKRIGIRSDILKMLEGPAVPPTSGSFQDLVFKMEMPFSLGFWKPWSKFPFGSQQAYGVWGAGGSCGFADPSRQLSFAYIPNKMGLFPMDDPRERALRQSVYACIEELS